MVRLATRHLRLILLSSVVFSSPQIRPTNRSQPHRRPMAIIHCLRFSSGSKRWPPLVAYHRRITWPSWRGQCQPRKWHFKLQLGLYLGLWFRFSLRLHLVKLFTIIQQIIQHPHHSRHRLLLRHVNSSLHLPLPIRTNHLATNHIQLGNANPTRRRPRRRRFLPMGLRHEKRRHPRPRRRLLPLPHLRHSIPSHGRLRRTNHHHHYQLHSSRRRRNPSCERSLQTLTSHHNEQHGTRIQYFGKLELT